MAETGRREQSTGDIALALVFSLATTLHQNGVLEIDEFIAAVRRQALHAKAAGAGEMGDALLELASDFATRLRQPPE